MKKTYGLLLGFAVLFASWYFLPIATGGLGWTFLSDYTVSLVGAGLALIVFYLVTKGEKRKV